jgi:hypothetical protein
MTDLMALAVVRRMLLELGHPELSQNALAPLDAWMHTPHPYLAGLSPIQVIRETNGEGRIRRLLAEIASKPPQ